MMMAGKKLSDEAVQELVETLYELIDLLPAQGLFTRQLKLFKRNLKYAIMENQEPFIHNVLEPFHYWLHENNIDMRNKKVRSITEGLKEIGAENEAPAH